MEKLISRSIQNCQIYKRSKAAKDRYNNLSKPLQIYFRQWAVVSFDFVTNLFINHGYNAILIVVNCSTKKDISYYSWQMKIWSLLKQVLYCNFRTFESFMFLHYHLFLIEALSLFKQSRKFSVRFLVFLLVYLHYFMQRQINKVRLSIKK